MAAQTVFAQTPPQQQPQQRLTIGVIEIENDPRYEPIRGYERLILKTRDHPYAGAQVGIGEAAALTRVLRTDFALERITVKTPEAVAPAVAEALAARNIQFFILDVPAEAFKPLAAAIRGKDVLLFNASASEEFAAPRGLLAGNRARHPEPGHVYGRAHAASGGAQMARYPGAELPLHLLLTRIDVPGVSGIEGVEWDAVELPSQFMENFCWEWDVLEHMTAHVDTQLPLPRALFDKMLAAKNFQSGMQTVRQIEFALFDMHLHYDFEATTSTPQALADAIRREVAVVERPPEDRSLTHSFSHIFAGGYAAGYYSYKWAEVLSADAYSLFEEKGVLSPAAGARFRDEVLARGGSRPALESFIAFRGRAPQIEALLRHNGMSTS